MGNKIQGMFANIKAKAQAAKGANTAKDDPKEDDPAAEGDEQPKI